MNQEELGHKQFFRVCNLYIIPPDRDEYILVAEDRKSFTTKAISDIKGYKENNALDFSEFRISFTLTKKTIQSPDSCEIRIYNVSYDTFRKIEEYSICILEVGYDPTKTQKEPSNTQATRILFQGLVKQATIMRVGNIDTLVRIVFVDNDEFYNRSYINTTLAKTTYTEYVSKLAGNYTLESAKMLQGETALPRGAVLWGLLSDKFSDMARSTGNNWAINHDVITIQPQGQASKTTAVVLNRNTGLIDRPKQTTDGIEVKCLINPLIMNGGIVQIDESSLDFGVYSANYGFVNFFTTPVLDGYYFVFGLEAVGDTRGNDWYMNLKCYPIEDPHGSPLMKNLDAYMNL